MRAFTNLLLQSLNFTDRKLRDIGNSWTLKPQREHMLCDLNFRSVAPDRLALDAAF